MNLHEYQAKELLNTYGVPIQRGYTLSDIKDLDYISNKLSTETGTKFFVVKAQIHAGGRGKGGGVKVSKGLEAVRTNAEQILGMQLVTHQTGPKGQQVKRVLVEEGMDIKKELYVSLLVDRGSQQVVMLASTEGGMDIEQVAANTPEKILKVGIDPTIGMRPYQATELAYGCLLYTSPSPRD